MGKEEIKNIHKTEWWLPWGRGHGDWLFNGYRISILQDERVLQIDVGDGYKTISSIQLLSSVWLCDPMDCGTPGFPVHHQLPELAQTHVHIGVFKAEHWRIDAFELWCWKRLLRVPWNAKRSNQSIIKEISPGCSLEGLMLKLKLQYFGHLMWGADSLEKTLMLGKIEGRRRRGWQRIKIVGWHHRLNGHGFGWTPGAGDG